MLAFHRLRKAPAAGVGIERTARRAAARHVGHTGRQLRCSGWLTRVVTACTWQGGHSWMRRPPTWLQLVQQPPPLAGRDGCYGLPYLERWVPRAAIQGPQVIDHADEAGGSVHNVVHLRMACDAAAVVTALPGRDPACACSTSAHLLICQKVVLVLDALPGLDLGPPSRCLISGDGAGGGTPCRMGAPWPAL
jgi:hypothetical protein